MSQDRFKTDSGIAIKSHYRSDDAATTGHENPGEYPFTRGIYPGMYRERLWTMRQYGGYATARETNRRFRFLLEHGQTGLSVAFDLPTQMGFDSDHALAEGEVGKVGVAICSLDNMAQLFEGIRLDEVTTSMTINATAAILLAFYVALAKRQGVELNMLGGTTQNDILKEYIARSTYIYPPVPSMRLVTDVFEYCQHHLPKWNTISISGYHIREAGSDAVQEVAFTLANGIEYVRAALGRGLDVDEFGQRLSFFFNSHNNFFEEVAKFRAARRMWATIMKQQFKASNPRAMMMRFHAQTAGSTLTAQQPDNNVARVTLQALAAVLGGTQSLHTNSRDEALALPTEAAVRVALRTQQIIAFESGVADCADPLAGSYFVEYLTNEIEARANRYLEHIEAMGGAIKAIEADYFQEEIARSAYDYQRAIEANQKIVVGVNAFEVEENPPPDLLRVDPAIRDAQVLDLQALRNRRDNGAVSAARQRLEAAARGTENLLPLIVNCVEKHATLGEISDSLRGIFGTHHESSY